MLISRDVTPEVFVLKMFAIFFELGGKKWKWIGDSPRKAEVSEKCGYFEISEIHLSFTAKTADSGGECCIILIGNAPDIFESEKGGHFNYRHYQMQFLQICFW